MASILSTPEKNPGYVPVELFMGEPQMQAKEASRKLGARAPLPPLRAATEYKHSLKILVRLGRAYKPDWAHNEVVVSRKNVNEHMQIYILK